MFVVFLLALKTGDYCGLSFPPAQVGVGPKKETVQCGSTLPLCYLVPAIQRVSHLSVITQE